MADHHPPAPADPAGHADHPADHAAAAQHFRDYMRVFYALCVLTAASFIGFKTLKGNSAVGFILALAIVKAGLVIAVFMHLRIDWPKLYGFIIPVIILCVMSTLIFLPDFVVYFHQNESP